MAVMTVAGLNLVAMVTITTGIAAVLAVLGLRQGALSIRPDPRRCPSCGQRLRSWTCWNCTDSRGT
jgi:hypothetical protein